MKVVDPSFEILQMSSGDAILSLIEIAGRTCYKSEEKITPDSSKKFVQKILESGHHSVIEHYSCTVKFICDRGISHELVRHRLASFSQESTRYANYSKQRFGKEITVIRPMFWSENSEEFKIWEKSMQNAENCYLELISKGASAQEARSVLPNSLKTEVVVTCNIREWRHIFSLRCDKPAHPQMRQIMLPLLNEFTRRIPIIFDDLYSKFIA